MKSGIYEFEPYRIDLAKRALLQDEETIPLQPKTFDLLVVLIENQGKVVRKVDLMEELWMDSEAGEENLTQHISLLRKALGEGAKDKRFIETVPRIGYKFLPQVREISATPVADANIREIAEDTENSATTPPRQTNPLPSAAALHSAPQNPETPKSKRKLFKTQWLSAAFAILLVAIVSGVIYSWQINRKKGVSGVRSIAVLPFKTFGEDKESEILKMAMTDAIITRLSRLQQIKVLPTGVVSRFRAADQDPIAAGRELKADAVLDGRVQKQGDQLRVTVQLINVHDGTTLWAEDYNENFSGIFDVQYEVARKLTDTLRLELSDEEKRAMMKRHTSSAEAYRLWLEGRSLFGLVTTISGTQQTVDKVREYFFLAIHRDPKFALAHVSLANTFLLYPPENISARDSYLKAKEFAKRALEIDESLADAHTTYAFAVWRGEWNWEEAEAHFQRAVDLGGEASNIYAWYSMLLSGKEEHEKAVEVMKKSPVLQNFIFIGALGNAYIAAREFDKAIEIFDQSLQKMPTDHNALSGKSWAYAGKNDYKRAIEFIEKDVALVSNKKNEARAIQAFIYAKAGRTDDAKKIVAELNKAAETEKSLNGGLAIAYGALGERDRAFERLERAIEEREWWCYLLKVHLMFDPLRDDARFTEMLRRVNLEN